MEFKAHMARVDAYLMNLIGLGYDDLPDTMYWDYWDSGMTAKETALQAIDDAGYGVLLEGLDSANG